MKYYMIRHCHYFHFIKMKHVTFIKTYTLCYHFNCVMENPVFHPILDIVVFPPFNGQIEPNYNYAEALSKKREYETKQRNRVMVA